ncbi:hypothetical protein GCM10022247_04320 [Allokutzneria multivorans]|uniref:SCP1.201-like deaminase n=1 Tax=Allokutzneria multivorans TaxID=1142134 RepID=A0ABP7QW59_9PSEU
MSSFSEVSARLVAARDSLSPGQLRELARAIRDELRPALAQVAAGSEHYDLHDALGLLGSAADAFEDAANKMDLTAERIVFYLADVFAAPSIGEPMPVPEPQDRIPARRSSSIPHPSTLPPKLMAQTLDPAWARTHQAKLRDRPDDTGPTTGLVFFSDFTEGVIGSGSPAPVREGHEDSEVDRAERETINTSGLILANSEHFPARPDETSFFVQTHVETKVATVMRQRGITYAAVVINNVSVCDGKRGCRVAVAAILPEGYTLVVWERGADEPVIIKGKALP